MFEDSLVESTGRIRTRSRTLALGSFAVQAALLGVLILLPYLYPAALPRLALTMLLTAPPAPPAPEHLPPSVAARPVTATALASLTAPRRTPAHAASIADDAPAPADPGIGLPGKGAAAPAELSGLFKMGGAPAPRVLTTRLASGPVRVSAGVASGELLTPIRPIYPEIAKAAHIQGTVVVAAVISKEGVVENARAISGPAMLARAALDAVAAARYRPYRLNGEPVEVETTINIVFSLN
jgi:protein TonB